jgi:N-acetyl-gamma-glutamyl-phosphate reductase
MAEGSNTPGTPFMIRVAILGGSGYTAVELMKLLLRHPQAEIAAVTSRQEAGKPIGEIHPSLTHRVKIDCEVFDADALKSKGVGCAFGCLPHGVSAEVVGPLLDRGIKVIDLSADYRLKNPDEYAEWYGSPHHDLKNLVHAVYGLPELNRKAIRTAQLIANPGCYPQTAILGLAPLVAAKKLHLDSIIIDSKSGVSGAGRQPKLGTLYPECNESFSAYNVGKHRHTPEIEQSLAEVAGQPLKVIFTPHLTPMDRGIFSTIYATPNTVTTEAELYELYRGYYANEPFVRIRKDLPATKDSAHTNYLDIALRTVRGRVVVLAAEDNLIRGASGVALQNFNILYGFNETAGLA